MEKPEIDDRPLCVVGKIRVGDEWVELRVVMKFNKGDYPESLYEAIAGKDYENGIPFLARIHDGCMGDK